MKISERRQQAGKKNMVKQLIQKNKVKVLASALMLLICFNSPAHSSEIFSVLGGQRVGTSAMTFLKIPVGARAEAMGGAYVAIANDEFAAYWNPAGIAQINNRWSGKYVVDPDKPAEGVKAPNRGYSSLARGSRSVGLLRINWLADVTYNVLAYVQPLPAGILGVTLSSLTTADMEITTEYRPEGTGEYFSYGDELLSLTYALPMTDNFSWGVSLKYARETLADTHMDNVMLDIGTYYWTGYRDLRLGVALVNFGPNARPEGTFQNLDVNGEFFEDEFTEYSPPTEFRLGGALTVLAAGPHRILTAFQLNHPVDNAENVKLGAEYSLSGRLFLRGGYKLGTDEDEWTMGAGIRQPWNDYAFSADFSYTDFGILEDTVRLSIGLNF